MIRKVMKTKKIKGRIIRILDKRTVIINLGEAQGITHSSIFYILGEPEEIKDPITGEVLGAVNVTKSRVKATQVFEKFTIATTSWTNVYHKNSLVFNFFQQEEPEVEKIDEGELKVLSEEIQPWKARSETPVRVDDEVEVTIKVKEELTQESNEPE